MFSLKSTLKRLTPFFLMDMYRATRPKKTLNVKGLSNKEIFTKIYEEHYWSSDQSKSGSGSDPLQTNSIKSEIEKVFREFNIKSVLDAPCGDFGWMNQVNLDEIAYTGLDIVDELIQKNQDQYKNLEFKVGNIIEDQIPKADLIVCRDCLVHFSFADIQKTLENFKKSGSKYLLTTSFIDRPDIYDIQTGYWRPINLQKPPFNFSDPILIIDEKCTEGGGKHMDKSLVLVGLDDIVIHP